MINKRIKKINWASSKLKRLFFKNKCQKTKKTAHNERKILSDRITDKRLTSRIYLKTPKSIIRK